MPIGHTTHGKKGKGDKDAGKYAIETNVSEYRQG